MEQLEFDCRLESERELEENVNIALEFACKQVKETSKSKVSNRHDGYGIASEFYAGMKLDQKKVDESMKGLKLRSDSSRYPIDSPGAGQHDCHGFIRRHGNSRTDLQLSRMVNVRSGRNY